METAWKSSNIKTEMQAPLPPLVIDALVQTESVSRENEACQTVKLTGIECGVQANTERRYKLYPERRTFGTQTIKVENVEITRTNALVQTDGSTLKNESCQTDKSKGSDFQAQVDLQPENELSETIQEKNMEIALAGWGCLGEKEKNHFQMQKCIRLSSALQTQ